MKKNSSQPVSHYFNNGGFICIIMPGPSASKRDLFGMVSEKVTLSNGWNRDLQRSVMKRSRIESPGVLNICRYIYIDT